MEYPIVHIEKPQSEWGVIGQGIGAYNEKMAGDDNSKVLCYVIQGAEEAVLGGVIAVVYWDWLYVDLMWMQEDLRGQGYGSKLLSQVEADARELGANHAHLDTFSFQARGFYEKHGYEVFGSLQDFPKGHQRYYMTKDL